MMPVSAYGKETPAVFAGSLYKKVWVVLSEKVTEVKFLMESYPNRYTPPAGSVALAMRAV